MSRPALAARAGTALEVRNSDPVMHNVRAVAGAQPVFNVAMPLEGMTPEEAPAGHPGYGAGEVRRAPVDARGGAHL